MPSPSSHFWPLPDPVHPARIGDVLIGPRPVKILASIMAPGTSDLIETAYDYQRLEGDRSIDILEWRADFFESPGLNAFLAAALELRQCTEKPVVWTLRTRAEGGLAPDDESYREQVLGMAASGLVDAVDMRDYPLIQACVLLFSAQCIVINLTVDLLYGWVNPTVRYQ